MGQEKKAGEVEHFSVRHVHSFISSSDQAPWNMDSDAEQVDMHTRWYC